MSYESTAMNDPNIYRFANCEVDPARRQVRIDNISVEAQPKALDLLVYLIRNRDRVIGKDELLSQLWPGVIVSESALTQALRKARAMVGDDGDRQSVIRTMQRRGFRFVAPMEGDRATTHSGAVPNPAPTERTSVAVLPFSDMSAERDQEYFCDGMSEEIINALTRSGMSVVSRTSTFMYKDQPFAAASQAASRAVELDPDASEAWTASGAVAAISGRFADAEEAFETAVRLGPQSFEAHYYYGRTASEMGWYEKAAKLYEHAASIDVDDYQAAAFAGQAYQSLGQIERGNDAKRRALAAAERAVALDPTDARALTLGAEGLIHSGRVDEARIWIERACALEPEEPLIRYNAACVYVVLGEHERALQLLESMDLAAMRGRGWYEHDSGLNPLREHPHFKAIMARAR